VRSKRSSNITAPKLPVQRTIRNCSFCNAARTGGKAASPQIRPCRGGGSQSNKHLATHIIEPIRRLFRRLRILPAKGARENKNGKDRPIGSLVLLLGAKKSRSRRAASGRGRKRPRGRRWSGGCPCITPSLCAVSPAAASRIPHQNYRATLIALKLQHVNFSEKPYKTVVFCRKSNAGSTK
jgi:hypothetical protein